MQSKLLTKPIKPLPEILFYKSQTTIQNSTHKNNLQRHTYPAFQYTAINTKTNEYCGKMIAAPIKCSNPKRFYPYKKPYRSFFIDYLETEDHCQGYGTKFIELAKNESKANNCEGRIHLIASKIYDRRNPPHIFYKKCGFISQSKEINQYLDYCIKLNKQISQEMSYNLDMFLPIKQIKTKHVSIFNKFLNFFKKFI